MNPFKKISLNITNALLSGYTPTTITRSCAVGLYIAFSPFPGLHSMMILAARFLFGMHLPTVFIIASLNNPWTMVPMYSFDYVFGYWLIHSFFGLNPDLALSAETLRHHLPSLADTLAKYLGSGKLCVWSFLVGGNIVGIVAALCCYPLVKQILLRKQTDVKQS
jgi:uncharacterized protein (DUF2062 family)